MEQKTVAIIGASGLIGSALAQAYEGESWKVIRISRKAKEVSGQTWKVYSAEAIVGADVVINLSGASIARRWTDSYKKVMRDSRVGVAENLASWIKASDQPPRVWVNASAVGIYGDSDDEILVESSVAGASYIGKLCEDWENATSLESSSCRVVNPRIGVVLGGGAESWERMVLPFKLFIGGRLSSGKQYFPWIHIQDVVGSIMHCVDTEIISGPVNLVAPQPVTNAEFTKQLASHLRRPAIFTVPRFALKLMLGGFADALLASLRVDPLMLKTTGYQFRYAQLQQVLELEL